MKLNTKKSSRDFKAFTLTELLVVIVIVATLAAITGLVVSKARKRAQMLGSVSNLRSLSTTLMLHASDNNGHLPIANTPTDNWFFHIFQYYHKDLMSFSVKGSVSVSPIAWEMKAPGQGLVCSYAMNTALSELPVARIDDPARTIALSDGHYREDIDHWTLDVDPIVKPPAALYENQAHIVFLDGHVRLMNETDLRDTKNWSVD